MALRVNLRLDTPLTLRGLRRLRLVVDLRRMAQRLLPLRPAQRAKTVRALRVEAASSGAPAHLERSLAWRDTRWGDVALGLRPSTLALRLQLRVSWRRRALLRFSLLGTLMLRRRRRHRLRQRRCGYCLRSWLCRLPLGLRAPPPLILLEGRRAAHVRLLLLPRPLRLRRWLLLLLLLLLLLWSPPLLVLVLEILLNTPLELGLLVNSTLPHLLDRRLRVPSAALPRALLPVYSRRPLPARRA